MKKVFFLISIICMVKGFGQNNRSNIMIAYPLTIGDNFFDRNDGVIDLGAQYRFVDATVLQIGIGFNAAFFKYENEGISTTENVTLLQPKVFAELDVPVLKGFKPFVGLGYGALLFRQEYDNGNEVLETKDDTGGINLNVGLAKDIVAGLFVHVQYDYMNIERDDVSVPDVDDPFYRNINILKLGVGYRF